MSDYLDNAALHQAFLRWRGSDQFPHDIPQEITAALMAIVDGLSRHGSFCNYSYLEDMRQEALVNCCQWGARSFDPARFKNPFSYFTMICWRSFAATIVREKKQRTPDAVHFSECVEEKTAAPDDAPQPSTYGPFGNLNAAELTTLKGLVQGRNTTARTDRRKHLFARLGVTDRGALLILLQQHGAPVALPIEHRPAPGNKRIGQQLKILAGA